MTRDPIAEIISYNRQFVGRYDDVLRYKLERLALDPFSFFRGTFHLFARDVAEETIGPEDVPLPVTGELPIVGDIHGENFGTYKAADGSVRYDINDFDETTTGTLDFDCCRLSTSLLLAARQTGLDKSLATAAVHDSLATYADHVLQFAEQKKVELTKCSDHDLPKTPVVCRLIEEAAAVHRAEYIDGLTKLHHGQRMLVRGPKFFDLTSVDRDRVLRLLADYIRRLGVKARQEKGFYDVVDVCGRVAGCGSLGRYRFVVLIAGHGDDTEKNLLLEIKESLPSGFDLCRPTRPAKQDECRAAQVTAAAQAMQTVSNRNLGYAVDGLQSFQVREIGPRDQRLDWKVVSHANEFANVAGLHAKLLAKAHAKAALASADTRDRLAHLPVVLHEQLNQFLSGTANFAVAYASLAASDHQKFVAHKTEVAEALGLTAK